MQLFSADATLFKKIPHSKPLICLLRRIFTYPRSYNTIKTGPKGQEKLLQLFEKTPPQSPQRRF